MSPVEIDLRLGLDNQLRLARRRRDRQLQTLHEHVRKRRTKIENQFDKLVLDAQRAFDAAMKTAGLAD